MIIALEPLDTLFFRDGKPFTMEEDTWADTMILPYPSVLYGALRSTYFANHSELFKELTQEKKLNTSEDPTTNLRITGIYYELLHDKRNLGPHLPLPRDLVQLKNRDPKELKREKRELTYKVVTLERCQRNSNYCSDYVSCSQNIDPLVHSQEVTRLDTGLISIVDYNGYYRTYSNMENILARSIRDHIVLEPKVGISLNPKTRSSQKHRLYRVGMYRYKGLRLLIQFSGLTLPDKGIMKLGGEGRAVSYQSRTENISIEEPEKINDGLFKLYLATPAIFEQGGWLPDSLDPTSLSGSIRGIEVELLAASIGKHRSIGGFDMLTKQPKPMRQAVPAGSVYYFQAKNKTSPESIIEAFHGKSLQGNDSNNITYKQQGFGIAYVAAMENTN